MNNNILKGKWVKIKKMNNNILKGKWVKNNL